MISIFDTERSPDSDDDSDYEPPSELFSVEGKTKLLNYKEKTEVKGGSRESQHLLESNLDIDNKLKEGEKSEVGFVETKNQADNVYKSFLEEAAEEMKLLKNECFFPETVTSEVNSNSSVDTKYGKESNSLIVNMTKKDNETTKSISASNNIVEDFTSDLSTNSSSNLEKKSITLHPISTMKRRDLKSVVGNINKKYKKETVLSMSKQDWQNFKEEENIANELKIYNQGKKGYLERQRFLERSDLRRFEIEREMRISKRQTQGKKSV